MALVVGVIGLVTWGLIYFAFPEAWVRFADDHANQLTAAGWAISLVGFGLTIFTLLWTQKIETDAVERARRETREAVEKIGRLLLETESEAFGRLVVEVRDAVRNLTWQRAVETCERAGPLGLILAGNPHLTGEEKMQVRAAADTLQSLARHIQRNRQLPGPSGGPLQERQTALLDIIIAQVTEIRARMRREVLEV